MATTSAPHSRHVAHVPIKAGLFAVLPFLVIAAHTVLSPYTKVEESFTLHAVRDILLHGIRPEAIRKVRALDFIPDF